MLWANARGRYSRFFGSGKPDQRLHARRKPAPLLHEARPGFLAPPGGAPWTSASSSAAAQQLLGTVGLLAQQRPLALSSVCNGHRRNSAAERLPCGSAPAPRLFTSSPAKKELLWHGAFHSGIQDGVCKPSALCQEHERRARGLGTVEQGFHHDPELGHQQFQARAAGEVTENTFFRKSAAGA